MVQGSRSGCVAVGRSNGCSLASFFVSRTDTRIEGQIDERVAASDGEAEALKAMRGKVATANTKLDYAWSQASIASERWQALTAEGARPQRLLWASTGVEEPAYRDTLYVDELIGPDKVNARPPATMYAFRDHGTVEVSLTQGLDGARKVMSEARRLGLDLPRTTSAPAEEGVAAFAKSFDNLLAAVTAKQQQQ